MEILDAPYAGATNSAIGTTVFNDMSLCISLRIFCDVPYIENSMAAQFFTASILGRIKAGEPTYPTSLHLTQSIHPCLT